MLVVVEQALIAAVDALHHRATLSDEEFKTLAAHYDDAKIFEIILLCRILIVRCRTSRTAWHCHSKRMRQGSCELPANVAYATPARSRSCRCTMPTGFPASVTSSAVIFDELRISRLAGEQVAADGLGILWS